MTRCYEPGPEPRHPLFRPLAWAGGLTPAALALVAVLGIPAVLGGCLLIWVADAAYHGESAPSR